jgi:hypothetical protein
VSPELLAEAVAPLVANLFGDLWSWVAGVVGRIRDISIYWLLAALVLKTAESALIGLTWRNILNAAYPHAGLSFKTGAFGYKQSKDLLRRSRRTSG